MGVVLLPITTCDSYTFILSGCRERAIFVHLLKHLSLPALPYGEQ
jgi:hypothetical protein